MTASASKSSLLTLTFHLCLLLSWVRVSQSLCVSPGYSGIIYVEMLTLTSQRSVCLCLQNVLGLRLYTTMANLIPLAPTLLEIRSQTRCHNLTLVHISLRFWVIYSTPYGYLFTENVELFSPSILRPPRLADCVFKVSFKTLLSTVVPEGLCFWLDHWSRLL